MKPDELAALPPARLPIPVTRAAASECRAQTNPNGMPTMVGHFSTFGDWYEVDSYIEGRFLERVKRGAFKKTIAESASQMRVLYDHGADPQIGNKVLGPIAALEERSSGAYYEVPLFDTSYNRDLVPGLEAGVYGASFRFSVEKDQWDNAPERSDANPEALPQRTITEARVFEFGPVTFPANPKASAGVRSTTDEFYRRSRDPEAFDALLRSARTARTPTEGAAIPEPEEPPEPTPQPEPEPVVTPEPVEPVIPAPTRQKPKPISREDFVAQLRQE